MTEYRIVPVKGDFGNITMYLQFKSKETSIIKKWFKKSISKTQEVWRFLPKELPSYVHGQYLNENDCPTSLIFTNAFDFISAYYSSQDSLKHFSHQYPDVQKYFEYLQEKRIQYLKKKKVENAAEIIYL